VHLPAVMQKNGHSKHPELICFLIGATANIHWGLVMLNTIVYIGRDKAQRCIYMALGE